MSAGVKLGVAAVVLAAAAGVLGALYAAARTRALTSHCRNNLRHLGGLAVRNWENLDKTRTGRLFWQEVRQAQYQNLQGKWSVPGTQPFTCPLAHAGAQPNPEDPATIDYLGPREVRKELKKGGPKAEPIGADRPGNHSSGGLVLRLDLSVDDPPPSITEDLSSWGEAQKFLKD